MARLARFPAAVLLSLSILCDFAVAVDADETCGADETCDLGEDEVPARGTAMLSKKKLMMHRASKVQEEVQEEEEEEEGQEDFFESIKDTPHVKAVPDRKSVPDHVHEEVVSMVASGSSRKSGEGSSSGVGNAFQPQWIAIADRDASKSQGVKNLKAMFDGLPKTWGGAVVFQVDLGDVHIIQKTRINWRICKCLINGALNLDSSEDGKTWTTYSWPRIYVWGGSVQRTYEVQTRARYIRIYATKVSPLQYISFWEIDFYGYLDPKRPNIYGWYHSYHAGTNGLGGTEILHITPHDNALFAGTGYWMNYGKWRGAEVVRLDCPFCDWTVEWQVNHWAGRIESLKSFAWTTDSKGQTIPGGPMKKLMTSYYLNAPGMGRCLFSGRLDSTKTWYEGVYWERKPWRKNYFSARAMELYQDTVTKVDHLFMVTGMDGIIAGTYNGYNINLVSFPNHTESGPAETRPLALTVHDGRLYFSASSYIKRRNNGLHPTWSKVFDMADAEPDVTVDEAIGGIRGLTSISHPGSSTGRSLLFAWSPNEMSAGCMIRLDPQGDGFVHTQEQCVKDLQKGYFGTNQNGWPAQVVFVIADYNNVLKVTKPDGGVLHLIGYQIMLYAYSAHDFPTDPGQSMTCSSGKKMSFYSGAGFLVRHDASTYEVREPGHKRYDPIDVWPSLIAVRTYAASPFPGDDAVYLGGHDCNHFPAKDTAWIMRGEADAIYKKPVPCKKELGCGHVPGASFSTKGCDLCRGREFDENLIANFVHGKPKTCQTILDWLNGVGSSKCTWAQTSDFARKCCLKCDMCLGTGKTFTESAIAGYTTAHTNYTCKESMQYVDAGYTTCYHATKYWKSVCCTS